MNSCEITCARTSDEDANKITIVEGLAPKVLADLQRFVACSFVIRGCSEANVDFNTLKNMKSLVARVLQLSARCNLLFRSNNRLRTIAGVAVVRQFGHDVE